MGQRSPDLQKVNADQTKVRQTLFNLLSNAAKFNDHGTISLHVARDGISESEIEQADGIEREAGRFPPSYSCKPRP